MSKNPLVYPPGGCNEQMSPYTPHGETNAKSEQILYPGWLLGQTRISEYLISYWVFGSQAFKDRVRPNQPMRTVHVFLLIKISFMVHNVSHPSMIKD